jgi:signal transduction histidine kinase
MTAASLTLADLRPVDLFNELDDDGLRDFVAVAHARDYAAGDLIAEVGEDPPGLILLLEGEIQAFIPSGGRMEPAGLNVAPTWIGAIAVLTEGALGIRVVAHTPVRLAMIGPEDFRRLTLGHPPVHRRVMHQVAPVMSRITAIEQNRERLTSLGTMAAGLAHELNNPAAAARRSAAMMADALEVLASTVGSFVESGMERDQAAELVALQHEALACAAKRTALDALDAADAEDALLERLEDLGVAEPWKLAEPLAAAGVGGDWLQRISDASGPARDAALQWIAASLTARALAIELQESTDRMSKLVGAIKSYAYMDRGEFVEVDLHEGLETTLTVLAHKLKHTDIKVVRDYDRTLPKLTVHGSELNQVWTNLLDNAIDALGDAGTITVRTRRDGPCAVVEISDDGPGIPPEIRDRVFDDFFTTKDVGEGTGLGLATARRIVVDRHRGSLTVASSTSPPTSTTFAVWLSADRKGPS